MSDESSSESKENDLGESSLNPTSMVPTKELTDEDIAKMKQDMAKELTPVQLEQFGQILSKFKKGATTKDLVDGMVRKCLNQISLKILFLMNFVTLFLG